MRLDPRRLLPLALAIGLAPLPAAAQSLFNAPLTVPVGERTVLEDITFFSWARGYAPSDMKLADLNGDGRLDAVVAYASGSGCCNGVGGVDILLGQPDGGFGPARTLTDLLMPFRVVVADVNMDGRSDLLVLGRASTGVAVFLATGPGTFGPRQQYDPRTATGDYRNLTDVAVADVTGDGLPDLLVGAAGGGSGGDNLTILPGTGGGAFASAVIPGGPSLGRVTTADLNGDGLADVIYTVPMTNRVVVRLGQAGGGLAAEQSFPVGAMPSAIAVADFDQDGRPDLALTTNTGLSVLIAEPGGFRAPTSYALPDGRKSVEIATGDLDGDGWPDLAIIGGNSEDAVGSRTVLVATNLGAGRGGAFGPAGAFPVGTTADAWPGIVAIGEVTGDAQADVVVGYANSRSFRSNNGFLTILRPNSETIFFNSTLSNAYGLNVADFNGDGYPDVLTGATATTTFSLMGTGTGAVMEPATRNPDQFASRVVSTGDFNGDGRPDLVGMNRINTQRVSVSLNDGTGLFARPATDFATGFSGAWYDQKLGVGDFDEDGRQDVAVASTSVAAVSILGGQGDGTFRAPLLLSFGKGSSIEVGDVNGDGHQDLVSLDATVLGHGDGSFGSPIAHASFELYSNFRLSDFNGDGMDDLVALRLNGGLPVAELAVLLSTGAGTFGSPMVLHVAPVAIDVFTGDMDGDGNTDIVTLHNPYNHATSGAEQFGASLLMGRGDGTFEPYRFISTGDSSPINGALVDMNGDGRLDLVITGDNGVLVYTNQLPLPMQVAAATRYLPTGFARTVDFGDLMPGRDGDIHTTGLTLIADVRSPSSASVVRFSGDPAGKTMPDGVVSLAPTSWRLNLNGAQLTRGHVSVAVANLSGVTADPSRWIWLYRTHPDAPWQSLGGRLADGRFLSETTFGAGGTFAIGIQSTTGVGGSVRPMAFALHPAAPNPFNPTTSVQLDLPESATVTMTVFNALGQQVRAGVASSFSAGTHQLTLDGAGLTSGLYWVRVTAQLAGGQTLQATQRALLVK